MNDVREPESKRTKKTVTTSTLVDLTDTWEVKEIRLRRSGLERKMPIVSITPRLMVSTVLYPKDPWYILIGTLEK